MFSGRTVGSETVFSSSSEECNSDFAPLFLGSLALASEALSEDAN